MNETYFARYTMPNGGRHTEDLKSTDLESAMTEAETAFWESNVRFVSICRAIVISGIPAYAIVAEFDAEFDRWTIVRNPITQVV